MATAKPLPGSLWAATAESFQAEPLRAHTRADVLIVGGGFTGLNCALQLAENGLDAVVVEANQVGYGGSGRNVGLANAGLWVQPEEVIESLGPDYGERLYQELAAAPERVYQTIARYGIECEADRVGTLQLARSRKGLAYLDERLQQLNARGAGVLLLDEKETQALTGSPYYRGAILDNSAGTIQPLGYVRGLARAASAAGARIYERSRVLKLDKAGANWIASTAHGSVTAPKVLIATNGYSGDLIPAIPTTTIPVNYFQFATAPLSPAQLRTILPQKHGCWDAELVMTSIRLDRAGRLIIGSVGRIEDGGDSSFLGNWAQCMLQKFYPELPKMPLDYRWSGQIAYSDDHIPHLHMLAPGMVTVVGYSGRGIGPGTVLGQWLAQYFLGTPIQELPLPISELKAIPLRKLRELYYARGSDLYHLSHRLF